MEDVDVVVEASNEDGLFFVSQVLEELLEDVVAKRVLEEEEDSVWVCLGKDLGSDGGALGRGACDDACFDGGGAGFGERELHDVVGESGDDLACTALGPLFQHMLDDVGSKGVSCQVYDVVQECVENEADLGVRPVGDGLFHDAAAVLVRGVLDFAAREDGKERAERLGGDVFKDPLDDMVPHDVLDEGREIVQECVEQLELELFGRCFKGSLDDTAAKLLLGQGRGVWDEVRDVGLELEPASRGQELLDDIVTVHVVDDGVEVIKDQMAQAASHLVWCVGNDALYKP